MVDYNFNIIEWTFYGLLICHNWSTLLCNHSLIIIKHLNYGFFLFYTDCHSKHALQYATIWPLTINRWWDQISFHLDVDFNSHVHNLFYPLFFRTCSSCSSSQPRMKVQKIQRHLTLCQQNLKKLCQPCMS
jgi:hypothetical protein